MGNFTFRPFTRSDYLTYKAWFEDPVLEKALGDIDEEWLGYVLDDKTGKEYAIFQDDLLIAVVGITYPTPQHPYYVITNFAVHPSQKNKGMGSIILKDLLEKIPLQKDEYWVAYVEPFNLAAQHFFAKNGWQQQEESEEEMIKYAYH